MSAGRDQYFLELFSMEWVAGLVAKEERMFICFRALCAPKPGDFLVHKDIHESLGQTSWE